MDGIERLQPKPKGPFPEPESYDNASCGPKPERPGVVEIGTLRDPVPVTGLAANFSPMPRIAPPPFGSDIEGTEEELPLWPAVTAASLLLAAAFDELATDLPSDLSFDDRLYPPALLP